MNMNKLTVLIKPVSSLCNMQCKYCFYKDIAQHRKHKANKMNINTMNHIIEQTLSCCDYKTAIEFCFQGGEPLLAGINFFKTFIRIVKEKNQYHQIQYSIQTNGILINEEWIQLFKQNHILIGVSLDGIETTHDSYRKIADQGTFYRVVHNIQLLEKNHIEYNILTVVTPLLSSYAKEIYTFYKKSNFRYVQFIPCLPVLNGEGGLKPKEYSNFFISLYDEWKNDKKIHISLFQAIENLFKGKMICSCGMIGFCSVQIVIEANGDIYPCDFYALDDYCLGNINNMGIKEAIYSQVAQKFLKEDKNFSNQCDDCQYYRMCQGNCKRQNICMFDDDYCGYKEVLIYMQKYTKGG